ncbi:MAG: hypothetical protein PSX36_11180 [bacterium]|nr:hypothetical protein [bacterium]
MKHLSHLYLSLFLLTGSFIFKAQEPQKIRFSKQSEFIYFFQVGPKSDSIIKNRSDRFYFLVQDSLKQNIFIEVENGMFSRTDNDSILKLDFLPGIKYETVYLKNQEPAYKEKKPNSRFELTTRVNGASEFDKRKIRIRVMDKRRNEILMESVFVFGN